LNNLEANSIYYISLCSRFKFAWDCLNFLKIKQFLVFGRAILVWSEIVICQGLLRFNLDLNILQLLWFLMNQLEVVHILSFKHKLTHEVWNIVRFCNLLWCSNSKVTHFHHFLYFLIFKLHSLQHCLILSLYLRECVHNDC
jgi:hypothetical protein